MLTWVKWVGFRGEERVHLDATMWKGKTAALWEGYTASLSKVNTRSAAEQLDGWCNFKAWIRVLCRQDMKVKLVNRNSVWRGCQNKFHPVLDHGWRTHLQNRVLFCFVLVFFSARKSLQASPKHLSFFFIYKNQAAPVRPKRRLGCTFRKTIQNLSGSWLSCDLSVDLQSPWQLSNRHLLMRMVESTSKSH